MREAPLSVAYGQMEIRVTRSKRDAPVTVWVVRAWEPAPPDGVTGVEWLLLTHVPVTSVADALERLDWYACRWVIEEYHQCLKSGCAIEERDFEDVQRLFRLIGFLSPIAVRLLQMRDAARSTPEAPAALLVEPVLVEVVRAHLGWRAGPVTMQQFWRGVARLGGYRGHRSDGPPGWKTIWRGWLRVQDMAIGVRLAQHLFAPA